MGNPKLNQKPMNVRVYDETEVSRKGMLEALEVGESLIFVCDPGQAPNRLQASIASSFRGGQSMSQQGLEQQQGLLVFEGDAAVAVTRVIRVRPKPGI
ncbi:hypothetical protein [Pseudomonas sp. P8_250]|uniref:hypothetical protein n=1 Tax=Pseudomonas sp. P8_250 TaxID=3043446 RepID=UPI002A35D2D4|nr:hypothetical protein [Pseudomonas sp. P8_250]MDX9668737.1 hypothetical protein [Pseudomonas sp. P8_250]